MKKFFLSIIFSALLCFLPIVSLSARATTEANIPPTFLPYFEGMNEVYYSLSVNVDKAIPLLKTQISACVAEEKTIRMTLPIYGKLIEIGTDSATLLLNNKKITPSLSYSKALFGFPSSFSHEDVLAMKITAPPLDLSIPCYYYSFTTDNEGTIILSLPENAVSFINFNSFSYNTATRQYNIKLRSSTEQSIIVLKDDLSIIATDNAVIEKTALTYENILDYAISFVSETGETDIDDTLKNIIYTRFADCAASEKREFNFYTDIIEAPFEYGFVYLDYTIELPQGESIIQIIQPLQFSIDRSYTPEVQTFQITAPKNNHVTLALSTARKILSNKTSFANQNDIYTFEGTIDKHLIIDVCSSDSPLLPHKNNLPIWLIILLSACGFTILTIILFFTVFNCRKSK